MLEDIRSCMMERMQTMRKTHAKWHDSVCPNIRKKFERIKDLHRFWHVIPSGEMKFEVKHGGYIVDEINRICSCRLWQLSGIPCEHATAAIYYLNINPDIYISDWLKTPAVKKAYNHYIYPLHGSDQWPETNYIPPLPPKARRMPGRNASESNGSSNREVRPKGKQKPWQDGITNASRSVQRGGISTNRGGRSINRGGISTNRGGRSSNRGGISTNRGGRSSNRCGLHIGMGVQVNPITGDAMLGSTRGVPLPAWPNGITPSNLRIQPQDTQVQVDDAPMINSQPTEPQQPVYQDDGVFDVEDSLEMYKILLEWSFCDPDARLFFHVACSLDGAKATGGHSSAKAPNLYTQDMNQVRGVSEDSINALPTHKFKLKKNRNNDPRDNDSGVDEGGILAPGTENERAISGEDAVSLHLLLYTSICP
ncbi:multidrug resistance-associated protein 5 [Tanacetum coccineum]